ncbi:MAG: phosphatidate cytidylyltransferase, partial [Nitrospirota bacterium]|nr:phosphatidate cytidylyltransferase [Nitrospirota bacterium]
MNSSSMKRVVSAAVALPVFVAYVYYLPPHPYFLALLIVAGMAAMREFFAMYRVSPGLNAAGVAAGGVLLYIFCMHPDHALYALVAGIMALMMLRLFSAGTPSGSMSDMGPLGVGFLYIGGCISFHWFLRNMHEADGLKYIFSLYMSVWLADSLAYYIGTYLGRNKLC